MSQGKMTTDHSAIRKWADERGANPATVKGTEVRRARRHSAALLRPEGGEARTISWDEFFSKFDDAELAFLHQDRTADGAVSRFHKFVSRANA